MTRLSARAKEPHQKLPVEASTGGIHKRRAHSLPNANQFFLIALMTIILILLSRLLSLSLFFVECSHLSKPFNRSE